MRRRKVPRRRGRQGHRHMPGLSCLGMVYRRLSFMLLQCWLHLSGSAVSAAAPAPPARSNPRGVQASASLVLLASFHPRQRRRTACSVTLGRFRQSSGQTHPGYVKDAPPTPSRCLQATLARRVLRTRCQGRVVGMFQRAHAKRVSLVGTEGRVKSVKLASSKTSRGRQSALHVQNTRFRLRAETTS